jgi:hypothetical protein
VTRTNPAHSARLAGSSRSRSRRRIHLERHAHVIGQQRHFHVFAAVVGPKMDQPLSQSGYGPEPLVAGGELEIRSGRILVLGVQGPHQLEREGSSSDEARRRAGGGGLIQQGHR